MPLTPLEIEKGDVSILTKLANASQDSHEENWVTTNNSDDENDLIRY